MFSLKMPGSTTIALYNNFLPITTALPGWLLLGETLSPLQIAGMVAAISAGLLVIMEKARLRGNRVDSESI